MAVLVGIIGVVLGGLIGYFTGAARALKQQKMRMYEDVYPPIIETAFEPLDEKKKERLNRALVRLWLFASKSAALKADKAMALMVHPEKGEIVPALQEAIAEARNDIQLWPWRESEALEPSEISHLYFAAREEGSKQSGVDEPTGNGVTS